jgi:cytochrome P450 / NADPH-cytochrome P450 reductase
VVYVGSQELATEVFDNDRFIKVPSGPLVELRALLGDGLFTAFLTEMNWWTAHRLLMPASALQ